MTHTYIPGKDTSLENAIARMHSVLKQHDFDIVEHSWGNPASNIWWVHIRDAKNPRCFTNGKGATKLAARASALGEFIERLSCNYFFADYYWGKNIDHAEFAHYPDERWFPANEGTLQKSCPEGLLNDELATFYDPDNELLISDLYDINTGITDRGICALPFTRQRDNTAVYFPVNIIGNLYVSNGMSAGNSPEEARTQALSEVFERWVKNTIIADGISLPVIPDEVMAKYPEIVASISEMQAADYVVKVFDASLGGRYPVIGAALLNTKDGGCLTSFGAHPNFAVALERTITELLQGRELNALGDFPQPSFDDDCVSDNHNLETHFIDSTGLVSWNLFSASTDYNFCQWDFAHDTRTEYEFLRDCLHDMGVDVYIADYDYLGFYACRIIVPSISEIYPVEELTQYNNNIGNSIRETLINLPHHSDDHSCEHVIDWLDESALDDSERVSQVLGLVVDSDNPWHNVRLGEIRCYCYLVLGEYDNALDMVEWVQTFAADDMPQMKQRFFACLAALLTIHMDEGKQQKDYMPIFQEVFGNDVLTIAQQHIGGGARFYDLGTHTPVEGKSGAHALWCQRYHCWQAVKGGSSREA